MNFQFLLLQLREQLREMVRNGQLTERGMARATGVSQPHLHNILKGIRALPPDLADQLLILAGCSLPDLLSAGSPPPRKWPNSPPGGKPTHKSTAIEFNSENIDLPLATCAVFQLLDDPAMEPRFHGGDIVYYRQAPEERAALDARSVYLVHHDGWIRARYLRMGGQRLYLVSEENLRDPARWDYVSLADRHILEIVRGRIVWICRKVEEPETGASEETRRSDRRTG